MKITKMSGAGNDFVMLGRKQADALGGSLVAWVRAVCRRGLSVGADGVIVVEPAGVRRVRMRFYNPDGSEAFCGNGTRCAARFASLQGLAGDDVTLETMIGEIEARLSGDLVSVTLPPPVDRGKIAVEIATETVEGRWIDAGVPHFVIDVDDVLKAPLERWGPLLRGHAVFGPDGTNVDVAVLTSGGPVALRTWERGVEGETLACGTGALAAAMAARLAGAGETIGVVPASGVPLTVILTGPPERPESAVLEGDARVVLEGTLSPEAVKEPAS